jgi:uncharacterized protein (TIGR03086 family)
MDLVALDPLAMAWTADLLGKAGPADWQAPTPCGDWTLRQLTEHLVAQNEGFAAATTGGAADPSDWAARPVTGDPHVAFVASSIPVTAAYSAPGVLTGTVYLAEFGRSFRGAVALSFHFVDYLAHGWDVARALGLADEPDPSLTAAGMAIAEKVPNGPPARGPGAPFAYRVEVPDSTPPHQKLIALLGRSPDWTAG